MNTFTVMYPSKRIPKLSVGDLEIVCTLKGGCSSTAAKAVPLPAAVKQLQIVDGSVYFVTEYILLDEP